MPGAADGSSLHAKFFAEGDALYLRNLNSPNGTYVNGEQVRRAVEVHARTWIQFADMPFRLSRIRPRMTSRTIHEDCTTWPRAWCNSTSSLPTGSWSLIFSRGRHGRPPNDRLRDSEPQPAGRTRNPGPCPRRGPAYNQKVELSVLMRRPKAAGERPVSRNASHLLASIPTPLEISGEGIVESMGRAPANFACAADHGRDSRSGGDERGGDARPSLPPLWKI